MRKSTTARCFIGYGGSDRGTAEVTAQYNAKMAEEILREAQEIIKTRLAAGDGLSAKLSTAFGQSVTLASAALGAAFAGSLWICAAWIRTTGGLPVSSRAKSGEKRWTR